MKRTLVLGCMCLLAAAIGFAVWQFGPEYQVRQRVKAILNDPDSAQFYEVTYNRKNGVGCGLVNAKNRMGGYVGKTIFIAFPDGDVRTEPGRDASPQENSTFLTLMDSNCRKS